MSFTLPLIVFPRGHDALSDEIIAGREWEPAETAVVRDILERVEGLVLDFGAHVGWYSVLAGQYGHPVIAWESDPEARALLRLNADRFDLTIAGAVTDTSPTLVLCDIALVKMDLEGEECNAVRMCRDLFYARRIAYALIEVSPIFTGDGRSTCDYVTLVEHIVESGYTATRITATGQEPLVSRAYRRHVIANCGQENILFERAP